ncbi:MAG: hypothetical protein AMJ77_04260 [Dehalococcoidia bacterium SM23_28_2]|nr:MAG: hypothetical protein AMJ77_04260 [Dehalococcoidia bacterium SM23_28_2]
MPIDLDVIFLALLFTMWAILGFLPWLALAVRRRGRSVLVALPLAIAGGAGGGVLVPAAGAKDETGLLLSLATAVVGGLALALLGLRLSRRRPNPT